MEPLKASCAPYIERGRLIQNEPPWTPVGGIITLCCSMIVLFSETSPRLYLAESFQKARWARCTWPKRQTDVPQLHDV